MMWNDFLFRIFVAARLFLWLPWRWLRRGIFAIIVEPVTKSIDQWKTTDWFAAWDIPRLVWFWSQLADATKRRQGRTTSYSSRNVAFRSLSLYTWYIQPSFRRRCRKLIVVVIIVMMRFCFRSSDNLWFGRWRADSSMSHRRSHLLLLFLLRSSNQTGLHQGKRQEVFPALHSNSWGWSIWCISCDPQRQNNTRIGSVSSEEVPVPSRQHRSGQWPDVQHRRAKRHHPRRRLRHRKEPQAKRKSLRGQWKNRFLRRRLITFDFFSPDRYHRSITCTLNAVTSPWICCRPRMSTRWHGNVMGKNIMITLEFLILRCSRRSS